MGLTSRPRLSGTDEPRMQVSVNWTEVPGSKLRPLSVLHMAWELLLILAGYKIFGTWRIVVLPS